MPNVMAALPNTGGALCQSSVIPFLIACGKVWLTHTARVALIIQEDATLGRKVNIAPAIIPLLGSRLQQLQKCTHNVPAHEMAKHRAKFD